MTSVHGVPAPFPLAMGDGRGARFLVWVNQILIRLSKRLFSYQVFLVVKPRPSLNYLMRQAHRESAARLSKIEGSGLHRSLGKPEDTETVPSRC